MNPISFRNSLLSKQNRDPKFREYLTRVTDTGLEMLALVEVVVPVLLIAAGVAVFGTAALGPRQFWPLLAMAVVGSLTRAACRVQWVLRHACWLGLISVWLASSALTWMPADHYVLAGITLVMVTAATTLPLAPWQVLTLGGAIEGMYILSGSWSSHWEISTTQWRGAPAYIFLLLLTLLAIGIAALNAEHRRRGFESEQAAVRLAETLSGAQLRAQLAENAIAIGKMAAALSHEINSPIGALRSSIETLLAVTDRQRDASPEDRERLDATCAELRRSISESASRIEEVTRHLRRFVNLEEFELRPADINDLVSDVALLHDDQIRDKHIRMEFRLSKTLPPLNCRPQLLTAAFSTLLNNAIEAVNGNGKIEIETRHREGTIEVAVLDNGRGMSADQAATIFEPAFKVDGGRVSSGNWSLFNTRQIVYEHGGEIRVDTEEGRGTAVRVILPVSAG